MERAAGDGCVEQGDLRVEDFGEDPLGHAVDLGEVRHDYANAGVGSGFHHFASPFGGGAELLFGVLAEAEGRVGFFVAGWV